MSVYWSKTAPVKHSWSGEGRRSSEIQCLERIPLMKQMEHRVPLINSLELQLRFLSPQDIDQVKILCRSWFPIDYPDTWYQEITSNPRFYSLAATLQGRMIGLVVAETKELGHLAKEDRSILATCFKKGTKVGYILSLGVCEDFRKQGIASLLLENLISHLTSDTAYNSVKALYLHVLTTNSQAIAFYEHRGFVVHSFLPYYYAIKGKRKDGFTYVLYLNGGHPTWGALDYVKSCALLLCQLSPIRALTFLGRKLRLLWTGTVPKLRRVAESSSALFS
ncbi:N-alpha-acetyltransferase 60 [Eurytemora carolleeae]|uniref:N-alpha-acetyltransferase 60 n=1 Tax=Eurytemora carolleeae TaxID=1294199 RepID=UPI000C789033|nr:N-alpha-acetyltransferase 60 [Eurytemora carolleeae]|eukprot:XP_023337769.1 N-alpha-acetyltransferase 60-like [Eurytemora affinis]